MKVFDLIDEDGRVFAFEVNSWITRIGAAQVAARIPNVRMVTKPTFLGFITEPDAFCEFELDGIRFEIYEPFGDNSRFWIGSEPPGWVPQLESIRQAFLAA